MKLGQKKWKSLVSGVLLAASASSFLIAPVFAGEYSEPLTSAASEGFIAAVADQGLEFTSTLTGVGNTDAEYANAGVIQADGSYKFTKDASITTSKTGAIEVGKNLNLLADQNLKLTVANNGVFVNSLLAGVKNDLKFSGSMSVQAKKLVINVDQTDTSMGAAGIYQQGKSSGKVTGVITADVDANIKASGPKSTYGIASIGNSELTVNGNVTMKGEDGTGFGITNNDQNDASSMQTGQANAVGLFADKNSGSGVGGILTVNGNVDLSVDGNAIYAKSKGSKITVNGDVKLVVNPNAKYGDYAIDAMEGSTVNVNMNEAGDASADHKVNIQGNVAVMADMFAGKNATAVNLGLSTKDSTWQGIVYNTYGDNTVGSANIWLSNGASWTNESFGKVQESGYAPGDYNEVKFAGSHVTKLVGGSDAAHAGNIFQNDAKNLTIDNYSGNTNIFYAHTGNGEAASDYAAGDTVIRHAEKDSVVSLITDNKDVNMSSADSIVNVLNSLAGKLTYSNFTKDENDLTGYVKIADGLTSSSAAMYTGDMAFSKKDGKGSLKDEDSIRPDLPAPDHQIKNEFTTTLTGVKSKDKEYYKAGVIKSDGLYQFTENSSITTTNANGFVINQATTIDAKGKTLTFNTNITNSIATFRAISADSTDGVTITADKLVLNAHTSDRGPIYGINVGSQQNKYHPMKLTINGDIEMNIKGVGSTLGLCAEGNANVTINGNVTAMGNEDSEWGLASKDGYVFTRDCSLVYNDKNYRLQREPNVTINGDVNAKIDGNCLFANGGKLTVNGGGNIEINKNNEHAGYAMRAESATTSMNVKLVGFYDAISARDNKLVLKGNVGASTGAIHQKGAAYYTKVNLGLATADSVWTGVAHNGFKDEGNKAGSKTFYGAINVFLQNGATWNNEKWGATDNKYVGSAFAGSHVAKFVGGSDAAHAGNIFQNDANNITIDNYSGNTNIYYAHTGNGEAADNYAAGDTVIRHAEKDSVVSLITDNKDVNMNSADSIVNVLNSLAGKLTYSNFTKDENNLTGYVKIADGLTSSSAAMYTGDMAFSKEDGKGSLKDEDSIRPDLPAPDHQIKNEFTTTLTGVKDKDQEYYKAGVIKDEGLYQFTQNSSITTTNAHGADMNQATTIDAKGKTLTFNTNVTDSSTIHAIGANSTDGVTITADKLVINGNSTNGRIEGINVGGQGQQNKDNPMKLTINGDTEMNIKGVGYTLGLYAAGNSEVTFNGNVTAMGNENSEWGLTATEGAFGYYGCSLVYSGNNYTLQMGPKVTINGDVNAKIDGNCLFANGGHAKLTINGGGNIEINKNNTHNYYAMMAECGTTSMNVNLDANYDAVSARDNKLVLKGNIGASTGATHPNEPELYTKVNLGLATADSVWTGVAHNGFKDEGNIKGDKTFYGAINVFLQNGATWNNEKWGATSKPFGGSAFAGSHVAKFVGGSDAAHAGNIFQNDANNITIDNYSGNTNIYYAHTGNGEAADNYAAGDTVIRHAEKDSVVSLITDNKDVNMNSADSIVNVLNSLAGKLTYSNFTKDENNLTGYVKIADGLTSSSAAMYTGDMAFSKEDGKGSLKDEDSIRPDLPAPDHQIKNEFTTTLTGVKDKDQEYYKAGVIKDEGLYQFTQNSSITTTNAHGADMNQATAIDAKGKTLTFNTNVTDSSTIHAIGANSTDGVTITADKLVLNANSTKGRVEAINVGGQGQQNKDKPMKLTINGDTEMNVKGINYSLGLYAAGNSEVTFNGNVTAMGDETSEWGLTSKNGAFGYYGCSLVYSGSNYSLQMGPKVTINGDVNAKIDGNCLFANGGHAKLTINGGGNIEINKNNEHTYYAMMAESATTSMNVNLDANYDAISARDNKLVLKGNVGASTGAMNANEPELYTKVNLGLATADSVWTGVAHNGFKDEGNKAGNKTFYGAINVFLQNGATWNNEKWGETSKPWGGSGFTGSHVAKFVGGSDAAHAGNIFQNDANNITIDNYSGNTNIYYAHTGNGEAADNYAAGDTIIRSAAEGSVVSLITDNSGISMDNEYSVANVLNTLAGKLTYSKFVNGEKNLAGYVKIADGLTASSAAMQTGNIAFNADTGKGSLENGSLKPGFTYPETQVPESNKLKQGITGDAKADYQYKKDGILKEDGSYVFTQDPTKIEVESGAAVSATKKNINIDTTKAKLELKGETGINANGADVTVKGNTNISGNVGINAANGNVTLNGSTVISGTDAAINAGEGGNVDINTNNSALNIKGDINANGGNITVDSGNATGTINGDVNASNGGNVEITLNDAQSKLTGSYNVDKDSSIVMNIKNGAVWELTDDDDEAAGMSLLRMAKAPAAAADKGLTINGGESKAKTGYLNMTKRTKDLKIASYSGWETIIYAHENKGSKDEDYKNGNTIINKAAKDSGVILSTDNSGIDMNDKAAVEATLKALAHKVTYTDHEANGSNLTGMVQIADGLTASSASKYLGNMSWDKNGKGQYVEGSVNWREIYNGNYETFVMKGVRSAATTSMHSWRDNMQDTYTGADLADADGIFAKALGGKTSSDVKGVKDSNTYRGVQVGFDKALANGWHAGAAFDYRNGDSNYLLGGKGDNQLYSFGVYGVKNFEDQSYLRVAAKAGRVENEYDVYNEIRTLKLHGDYKSNAYGLTMEYGKTFGTEASYFTPKAQLTWSQVGAKDYTAHTPNDSMSISQDAYSSLVARFGVEAGAKSEKGRVYVGLYGAHEFNGDISASYFAKDGGIKHTSFDGTDNWIEMSIGGSYDLSDNCHIYADFAKDFKGDFERKWKLNAGLRFEF